MADEAVNTAYAKGMYVRVTPTKARRVVDLIRDLPAQEALSVLRFAPQAASEPVARAYVDEGPMLKRFRPRAQGRAYRINKRTSHITIEVESIDTQRGRK